MSDSRAYVSNVAYYSMREISNMWFSSKKFEKRINHYAKLNWSSETSFPVSQIIAVLFQVLTIAIAPWAFVLSVVYRGSIPSCQLNNQRRKDFQKREEEAFLSGIFYRYQITDGKCFLVVFGNPVCRLLSIITKIF